MGKAPQFYLVDLHCHTIEHSYDGKIPVRELLAGAVKAGFHGVVLTDHSYCWPDEELAEVRASMELPPDFVLLSGQEVRTAEDGRVIGDLLVYGPKEHIPDGTSPDEVIRLANAAGGFCIAAHVGMGRIGLGDALGDYPIIGAETWNGRYGTHNLTRAEQYAERYHVPQTGGSDAHQPRDIGGGATVFSRLPQSIAELKLLIMSGDVAPWRPPVAREFFSWLRALAD